MKEDHFDWDNIGSMTWSLHDNDCNYEHRSVDPFSRSLHGWKTPTLV